MACKGSGVQIPSAPLLEIPRVCGGFRHFRGRVTCLGICPEPTENPREIALVLVRERRRPRHPGPRRGARTGSLRRPVGGSRSVVQQRLDDGGDLITELGVDAAETVDKAVSVDRPADLALDIAG